MLSVLSTTVRYAKFLYDSPCASRIYTPLGRIHVQTWVLIIISILRGLWDATVWLLLTFRFLYVVTSCTWDA